MHRKTIHSKLAAMIATLIVGVSCLAQNRATTAPAVPPEPIDPAIDRILTRLENRTVHDLRAQVTWKLKYIIDEEDDATIKQGRIWYQQQAPVAKFLVHFDSKISANRRHKLDERHMFDGHWYVELKSETRTVIRREVRREGEAGNPYRLGEGPFPVPFGQKKRDILEEFEVSLVAPAPDDPADTDHLRLNPRADSQTGRNYKTVEVWVARTGPEAGLPVKVHTSKIEPTGQVNSFITITFKDAKLNQGFSGSVFDIKTPSGYHEEIEKLVPIMAPPANVQPVPAAP